MGAKKIITSSLLILLAATTAMQAATVHKSRRAYYRHVKWNPVLKGSRDSMTRQNEEIDRLQLPRIADQQQLMELERTGELVPIEETASLRWSSSIQADKRFARPWTNQFMQDMSE